LVKLDFRPDQRMIMLNYAPADYINMAFWTSLLISSHLDRLFFNNV